MKLGGLPRPEAQAAPPPAILDGHVGILPSWRRTIGGCSGLRPLRVSQSGNPGSADPNSILDPRLNLTHVERISRICHWLMRRNAASSFLRYFPVSNSLVSGFNVTKCDYSQVAAAGVRSHCAFSTSRRGSRILVRGAQWSFDPRGDPKPKICSKLPENCMILKKILGHGGREHD